MVERDVVLAKLARIERARQRIAEVRSRGELMPLDVEELVILNLQRATQAAIDLATHVIATEGYGLPDSLASSFSILSERGVIDEELAERLRRMVGFRNIAVHEYDEIDWEIVQRIVGEHLGDLTRFGERIIDRFGISAPER